MIKKGDNVYIRTGSDRGKTGRVLWVNRKKGSILIEGVNMRKRHERPSQKNQKGGIITVEMPVNLSNVSLAVQTDDGLKPTRIKSKTIDEGGKKTRVRISVLTGEQI